MKGKIMRDKGIDFLMFLAVLLVVNSHLDKMYPSSLSALATGGAIGNALFFFCSGYKLFLGRWDRFDCWYKRRIVRIWPTVIVWDVVAALVFSLPLSITALFDDWYCGYWFVKCIMIHYVALYVIRRYMSECLWVVFAFVCMGVLGWWAFAFSPEFAGHLFGATKFEWYYDFMFTLLGGIMATRPTQKRPPMLVALAMTGIFTVAYYGWLFAANKVAFLLPIKVLALGFSIGIILSLYSFSRCQRLNDLMVSSRLGALIAFCGGLCLEVYVSHCVLVSEKFNAYFPLNIAVVFGGIFVCAYLIRCLTRFVVQTLSKEQEYDYAAIFKL